MSTSSCQNIESEILLMYCKAQPLVSILSQTNRVHTRSSYLSLIHFNPLNAEVNPICHLLALLGDHRILHVSRIRVNTWRYFCRVPEHIFIPQKTCIYRHPVTAEVLWGNLKGHSVVAYNLRLPCVSQLIAITSFF